MASQNFQLVMQKGPNPGKIFELVQDELTIGRDITNRIVINDPEVSRRHAKLTAQAGGFTIEDLGSTNGTFVDGQRLMGPHMLRPGQTVMLGEKISLAYEALGFDPNATLVGQGPQTQPGSKETFRVSPDYVYPPPAPAPQPETPAYTPPPPAYTPPPPPAPAYTGPSYSPSTPAGGYAQPGYSGQVPAGPSDPYAQPVDVYEEAMVEEPAGRSNRTLLFAGCGVLLIMACCAVAALVAFDSLDMYCQAPFNALSGILWTCP